jgi:hypothetical protein
MLVPPGPGATCIASNADDPFNEERAGRRMLPEDQIAALRGLKFVRVHICDKSLAEANCRTR